VTTDDASALAPTEFEKCFPNPTGNNGYEEIVRAGEILDAITEGYPTIRDFTLAKKIAYIGKPECQEALRLAQQASTKPFSFPRHKDLTYDFPYSSARAVSRLLGIVATVQLAKGQHDLALRTIEDSFRLSYPLRSEALLPLLVSYAMDMLALRTFVKMREVWTVRDCQHVQKLAEQQLALPDPLLQVIEKERADWLHTLQEWQNDTEMFAHEVGITQGVPTEERPLETREQRQAQVYGDQLRLDANLRANVLSEMLTIVHSYYDQAIALAQNPTRRMEIELPKSDTNLQPITNMLTDALFLGAKSTVQRGIESRLMVQLMGVHAAIRRYRWEYERLPAKLGDLAIRSAFQRDPYTGKSLIYTVDSDASTYKLYSAGALSQDENGKEIREPFSLPWEKIAG
jgi:hypothetical protein